MRQLQIGNEALLLVHVRFVMDQKIHEELLFVRTLTTDTKGEAICNTLSDYFTEKVIHLSNIISAAGNAAPPNSLFISLLKQKHYVIYRQHLLVKNLSGRLHQSLSFSMSAVNKIRSTTLNTIIIV